MSLEETNVQTTFRDLVILIVLDDDWQIFDSQEIHLSYSTKDRAKVLVDKLTKERPGNPHETRSFSRIVYISIPEENLK